MLHIRVDKLFGFTICFFLALIVHFETVERKMSKSIAEINEKIARGQAVVVTAEEVIDLVKKKGTHRTATEVDVVTTGTFGPMCSSGGARKTEPALTRTTRTVPGCSCGGVWRIRSCIRR